MYDQNEFEEVEAQGCLTLLFSLVAAIFLWKWADRQDAKDQNYGFMTGIAFLNADTAARRWNEAEQEGYLEDTR